MRNLTFALLVTLAAPLAAWAADPDPKDVARAVDAILNPETFKSKAEMTTHRTDGSTHTYRMEISKKGRDKTRLNFSYPPDQAGTQLLRDGENLWSYVVNLRRPLRIASRQQLMGGDFSNGDLLRLNLIDDYTPSIKEATADTLVLELKAVSNEVTYDRLEITVTRDGYLPLEQKVFTVSGKHIKTLRYEEPKTFGALKRPTKLTMLDALTPSRSTVMTYETFQPGVKISDDYFTLSQLGR
jgi:outer membrane lipoprotein-sorting protein